MALRLSNGPLKNHSGLEPVLRCEPITYQPISHRGRYSLSRPILRLGVFVDWNPVKFDLFVCLN